ncbi:uncharacterized protein LOC143283541 [Babylonia areolata]|uniref:uncharacterized protein LOC143283541 n=1 Tax=Babylonia areolata TaxID=304850 RepID=UPI003FD68691
MEFIPWNNSDNIVSAETESIVMRIHHTVAVCLFLIGGPGNVINMAVFYKQGISDRVNLCLFFLSLADELHLASMFFFFAEPFHLQFTMKEMFGPFFTFIVNNRLLGLGGFTFVSNVLSAIIAIERCVCVISPLKVQTLMRARTMAAVIIAVFVVVISLYFLVMSRFHLQCLYDASSGTTLNTLVNGDFYSAHKELIDIVDATVFGVVGVPMVTAVVVTVTTLITVVRLRQVVTWRLDTSSSLSAREVALTRMLVVVSGVFLACVVPMALTPFLWLLVPEMNSGRRYHNLYLTSAWISNMLTVINSTFNIFVYYPMGSRYRETLWTLCGRKTEAGKQRERPYSHCAGTSAPSTSDKTGE